MPSVHLSSTEFELSSDTEVDPQDILDAARTLKPKKKLSVRIAAPGRGPAFFLDWAKLKLLESENASTPDEKARKAFNVSVQARCAVECLIDWYLARHLLDLTIPNYAGLVAKLEALQADELLGIGRSLFTDTIFEPRNNGVHRYEPVDPRIVRKAVELADLTIRNCVHSVPPGLSPIFYGTLDIAIDETALARIGKGFGEKCGGQSFEDFGAFYFGGVGVAGECSVFIDQNGQTSRIVLLTSEGHAVANSRSASVRKFSSAQLRDMFSILDSTNPEPVELRPADLAILLSALNGRPRPTD